MSSPYNPYQTPTAVVDDVNVGATAEAETIRRAHIKHEASIRSVGSLYYLSTLGLGFAGSASLLALGSKDDPSVGIIFGVIMVAFAIAFAVLGHGLRALRRWTRIPTVLLSVIGLLGFPVGTLINGYIMWLLLSKKGAFIFSPEYEAIVAATPQVKYRTSIVVWILLGLIVVGLGAAILLPMFAKGR